MPKYIYNWCFYLSRWMVKFTIHFINIVNFANFNAIGRSWFCQWAYLSIWNISWNYFYIQMQYHILLHKTKHRTYFRERVYFLQNSESLWFLEGQWHNKGLMKNDESPSILSDWPFKGNILKVTGACAPCFILWLIMKETKI